MLRHPHKILLCVCQYCYLMYSLTHQGEGQCEGGSGEESDGEEDGFFVPHGYLSDDEGEQSDGEMGNETGPDVRT